MLGYFQRRDPPERRTRCLVKDCPSAVTYQLSRLAIERTGDRGQGTASMTCFHHMLDNSGTENSTHMQMPHSPLPIINQAFAYCNMFEPPLLGTLIFFFLYLLNSMLFICTTDGIFSSVLPHKCIT